jgi:opacity protein-like surface antigen
VAVVVLATIVALLGCAIAPGVTQAGTKGGLYDFSKLLSQPHPFSGTQIGPAAGRQASAPAAPVAAQARPAPVGRQEPPPGLLDSGDFFEHWYIRAGGGLDLPDDLGNETGGISVGIDVDHGLVGEVAIGRYLGRSFRTEMELAYRQADLTDARAGGAQIAASGDYRVMSAMLNGFYDLRLDFPIVPYVGAGIGAARIDVDSVSVGGVSTSGDASTEFAYQGIVGLSWRFYGDFTASVDYRYFGTAGGNDNATMSVVAGIRYDL